MPDDPSQGREPGPALITFGCRLNAYESEVIRRHAGAVEAESGVPLVVVNTCAVTAEAERQARQAIRKARRANPEARIVVTGCAAQIAPESWAALPEVDHVLGNEDKLRAETWQRLAAGPSDAAASLQVTDIQEVRETAGHLIEGFEGRARAFVQVQQGCDHRCTFCVIPYGRGPSRSVPIGEIVRQVRTLAKSGYCEIVLSGVDITAYGPDLPGSPTLGQMVRRLLAQVPEVTRLRLSSLDPVEIDDDLWRLIAEEPRLMPHLHLSAQAGDDLILKRMKRRHARADVVALCDRARTLRPGIAFGADLIAGFPTESEAMFANSLALVEDCDLAFLHVFPYSERPGTPAARMPALPMAERKARAARLRAAGEAVLAGFLQAQVGRVTDALIEQPGLGRTPHFARVALATAGDGPSPEPGAVVPVRLTGVAGDRLTGMVCSRSDKT
ncbi:MAG: tRNA (N(6)-L-threonylcarbamoyladenosine(37)-C(2))-methylthiotransferase MtaB [Alphaproteobacteria bacterium]|jgi:threonylcarbamoyladenosine tRNA methylthiotransferase MtaB|nr:tRNA (N(6)-L-threonylcarbamoyladenosine(37)-C(2))-methylthiotransferase MtaB [Alphaproteobacteria bacterium]